MHTLEISHCQPFQQARLSSDGYPKTKKFSVVGNLKHARYGHETIQLSDTEYLLIGGWGPSEKEAKEFDCWRYEKDGSCAIYNRSPRVKTREVELFDIKTGESVVVGHTLSGRFDFSALQLPNKKVLIHGGEFEPRLGYVASELYDQKTGKTEYVGEKRELPPGDHPSDRDKIPYRFNGEGPWYRAIIASGKLLICGTNQVFIYKPEVLREHSESKIPYISDHLIMQRERHHLITTRDGRIFVLGGFTYDFGNGAGYAGRRPAQLIEEYISRDDPTEVFSLVN